MAPGAVVAVTGAKVGGGPVVDVDVSVAAGVVQAAVWCRAQR